MHFKPSIDCGGDRRGGDGDRRISSGKKMDALTRVGVEERRVGVEDRRKKVTKLLTVGDGSGKSGYQDAIDN